MCQPCHRFCLFSMAESTVCNRICLPPWLEQKVCVVLTTPHCQEVRSIVWKATASLTSCNNPALAQFAFAGKWASVPADLVFQPRKTFMQNSHIVPSVVGSSPLSPCCSLSGLPRYQHGQSCPQDVASFLKHVSKMMRFLFP